MFTRNSKGFINLHKETKDSPYNRLRMKVLEKQMSLCKIGKGVTAGKSTEYPNDKDEKENLSPERGIWTCDMGEITIPGSTKIHKVVWVPLHFCSRRERILRYEKAHEFINRKQSSEVAKRIKGIRNFCFKPFLYLQQKNRLRRMNRRRYVEPKVLENMLSRGQYEDFARLMGLKNIDLAKLFKGKRACKPMRNPDIEEGNVLPDYSEKEEEPVTGTALKNLECDEVVPSDVSKESFHFEEGDLLPHYEEKEEDLVTGTDLENRIWDKFVPYVISKTSFTKKERKVILKAIAQWNKDLLPNIGFRPHKKERDYVFFFSGSRGFTFVGRAGGPHPLCLHTDNGYLTLPQILHEMSHTVGIIHEHQRPDRDRNIKILHDNLPEEWKTDVVKYNRGLVPILGPYDFYSLMHYSVYGLGNLPAFEVLQEGIDLDRIGKADGLTQMDIEKIKRLYS